MADGFIFQSRSSCSGILSPKANQATSNFHTSSGTMKSRKSHSNQIHFANTSGEIQSNGIEIEIYSSGNKDGPLVIFIHGFPDSPRLWERYIKDLENDFYCVNLAIPGFGRKKIPTTGYDFEAVVLAMTKGLDRFICNQNLQGQQKVLCAHDWGCFYGYLLDKKNPGFFDKIIAHDVGAVINPSVKETILISLYQGLLILAFLIGGNVGDLIVRRFATIVNIPVALDEETVEDINSIMAYPYYFLWIEIIKNLNLNCLLEDYVPHCPTLFMYGTKGPFDSVKWFYIQFSSNKWLEKLLMANDMSKVVAIESNHWFFLYQHTEVMVEIKKFLLQTPRNGGKSNEQITIDSE